MDSVIAVTTSRCLFANVRPSHRDRWRSGNIILCEATARSCQRRTSFPKSFEGFCRRQTLMASTMVPHRRSKSHHRTVKVLAKGEENDIGCAVKQRHGSRVRIGVAARAVPEDQQQRTGVALPEEREEQKSPVQSQISVKICGVAYPEDATWAARCGADFVGMILWPKSKRSISRQQAVDVANAAKEHGAVPVGVFVEEGVEEIVDSCTSAGIAVAQLHGDGARRALGDLPDWLQVVYVVNADKHGTLQPASLLRLTGSLTPEEGGGHGVLVNRRADWVLIDGLSGGSGVSIDWERLEVPHNISKYGWWLAGGLHPGNVRTAVRILSPDLVDVSSGVAGLDGVRKDSSKVKSFIDNAKSAVLSDAAAR